MKPNQNQSFEEKERNPDEMTAQPSSYPGSSRPFSSYGKCFQSLFGNLSLKGASVLNAFIACISTTFSLFHLYTAGFGAFTAMLQRNIHLTFSMVLIFLIYPHTSKKSRQNPGSLDLTLSLLSFICGAYTVIFFKEITIRINTLVFTSWDYIIGGIAIILVLEVTRRTIGWALTSLSLIFLAYAYFGRYMPGLLNHRGYSINKIISHVYLTTEGIFGTPLAVSATFVVVFIIFGAFLEESGAGSFFIDLANALTGKSPGGPAKAAVTSSGLMGMMSGSAIANVATTGVFTIPLMKRAGYAPYQAGGIEAVASTGGMFMPPILGAVAFIMAEYTGITYVSICIASVIPVFLYYMALYCNVHLEAIKNDLKGLGSDQVPKLMQTLKDGAHLLIPIGILVALLIKGYSPMKAAFYAVLLLVAVIIVRNWNEMSFSIIFSLLSRALISAGKGILPIAAACACAGIVIGVITLTGIGLKFSAIMVDNSGGIPFLMLLFMAVTCLILGMGLPPSASYIITAALGAPALLKIGYPLLGVHMFIFYYANLSNITPPVAMAAYTAAGIADAQPMKAACYACKIGVVAFMIPFMFIYWPELLMQGALLKIVSTTATTIVGILALTSGIHRHLLSPCKYAESALLIVGGLLLMTKGHLTDLIGIAICCTVLVRQYLVRKRLPRPQGSSLASSD